MIKVEHTKEIKLSEHTSNLIGLKLVTDAELVLIDASGEGNSILVNQLWVKPLLISRTEKYNIGELVYSGRGIIGKFGEFENSYMNECFKILALPEHFSPQQLQDIVDGKLKEGKIVVECERELSNTTINMGDGDEYVPTKFSLIKLNFSNHVTIYPASEEKIDLTKHPELLDSYTQLYPVEKKIYTKQDLLKHIQMYELSRFDWSKDKIRGIEIANKWFEKNVK